MEWSDMMPKTVTKYGKKNLYGNVHRFCLFVDYFISSMEKVLCIGTGRLGVRCSVFGMFHVCTTRNIECLIVSRNDKKFCSRIYSFFFVFGKIGRWCVERICHTKNKLQTPNNENKWHGSNFTVITNYYREEKERKK